MPRTIPKLIHKVLILSKNTFRIEKSIQQAHMKWIELNPGYRIMYWNLNLCRHYLACIDLTILEAFDAIAAYAGKTDLFRYVILYHMGGWYSDWRQIPVVSISEMIKESTGKEVYYSDDKATKYTIDMNYKQNCFIGSTPYNEVMKYAYMTCLFHVSKRHYGLLAIDATAGGVFTKAVERYPQSCGCLGEFIRIQDPLVQETYNIAYGIPIIVSCKTGAVIIYHKIAKSIEEENIYDYGNNYCALWRTNMFYQTKDACVAKKITTKESPRAVQRTRNSVWISMYAGEGLFYALRDEILCSLDKEVLLTQYDRDSFRDRWRLRILRGIARTIYFNGESRGELPRCPPASEVHILSAQHEIESDVFEPEHQTKIRNDIRETLKLSYEPRDIFLLTDKSILLYDHITENPIDAHFLNVRHISVDETTVEELMAKLTGAKCMIAVHGECLANMVMVAPECLVVEISLRGGSGAPCRDACWHNMAHALGQPYCELVCERFEEGVVYVDSSKLLNILFKRVWRLG